MCWVTPFWSGDAIKTVFITTNRQCSAEFLADLVIARKISLREVDPCCRGDVEELVIQKLMDVLPESLNGIALDL